MVLLLNDKVSHSKGLERVFGGRSKVASRGAKMASRGANGASRGAKMASRGAIWATDTVRDRLRAPSKVLKDIKLNGFQPIWLLAREKKGIMDFLKEVHNTITRLRPQGFSLDFLGKIFRPRASLLQGKIRSAAFRGYAHASLRLRVGQLTIYLLQRVGQLTSLTLGKNRPLASLVPSYQPVLNISPCQPVLKR